MYLKYLFSSFFVRDWRQYYPVKPTGPQQGSVKHVRPVCRSHYNNVVHFCEPVHLSEYLIHDSLCDMGPYLQPSSWSKRVNLIKEYDSWRDLPCSLENLPHSPLALADPH